MQARYYDPDRGGFLSVDPLGPMPGNAYNFNRYDYAGNNPVVNIDPDGRQEEDAAQRAVETQEAMELLQPKLGPNMALQSALVQAPGESDTDLSSGSKLSLSENARHQQNWKQARKIRQTHMAGQEAHFIRLQFSLELTK